MTRADYRMLTDGKPVPDDNSHKELQSNGMQKSYVILTPEERQKGFLRHVRLQYRHTGARVCGYDMHPYHDSITYGSGAHVICCLKPGHEGAHSNGHVATVNELERFKSTGFYQGCDTITSMSIEIAETFARDPWFYSGTFCCKCASHFDLREFIWLPEGDSMFPMDWSQEEIDRIIDRRKELGDLKESS